MRPAGINPLKTPKCCTKIRRIALYGFGRAPGHGPTRRLSRRGGGGQAGGGADRPRGRHVPTVRGMHAPPPSGRKAPTGPRRLRPEAAVTAAFPRPRPAARPIHDPADRCADGLKAAAAVVAAVADRAHITCTRTGPSRLSCRPDRADVCGRARRLQTGGGDRTGQVPVRR